MKRLLRGMSFALIGCLGAIALSVGGSGLLLENLFLGDILGNINPPAYSNPQPSNLRLNDPRVGDIEQTWQEDYHNYFDLPLSEAPMAADEIRRILGQFNQDTETRFALLYIFPHPENLELVLLAPGQDALQLSLTDVPQNRLEATLSEFQQAIANPARSGHNLDAAQQLYQWLIAPVNDRLSAWNIDTLMLCVGAGVRSAPLAALHDGQQFLIEHYNLSIIPAFSLIDKQSNQGNRANILAMGASEFQDLGMLPAVPVELREIDQDQWSSEVFLNEEFTKRNLMQQLASDEFAIVHLATHAAFEPGTPDNSYIQLWQDDRIDLNEMRDLGWRDRPIDLLVLSACETALGDRQAEMGFAGLSFQSGVRTTLASLWQVSDTGSLALMREFYWQLAQADVTTKAEALRRAQQALLQGEVYVEDGFLYSSGDRLALPENLAQPYINFTSPYNWASFTLVGSPW